MIKCYLSSKKDNEDILLYHFRFRCSQLF